MKRWPRFFFKCALSFSIVLLLFVLLVELGLRFLPPLNRYVTFYQAAVILRNGIEEENRLYCRPNVRFVYRGRKPGTFAEFEGEVHTNSLGFHDREWPQEKPPGVFRILILGDSFVEALQVPQEKSFHKRLQARLRHEGRNVEVIAMSRSGTGPATATVFYKTLGKRFSPDLVLWAHCDVNDLTDSHAPLRQIIRERQTRHRLYPPECLSWSVCATFLYSRNWATLWDSSTETTGVFTGKFAKLEKLQGIRDVLYLAEWPPIYEIARERFEASLRELVAAVREDELPFIAISLAGQYRRPTWQYPTFEWDPERPERLTRNIVEAQGGKFLTVKPLCPQLRTEGIRSVYLLDGHLNEAGHARVADALLTELSPRLPAPEGKASEPR